MAALKEYAYQIRGNQLSVIERDAASVQDGQTLTAPSIDLPTGAGTWKSPLTAVANGIEIEYAYSPIYSTPSKKIDSGNADNYHTYNGWFIVDGYLTLGATATVLTTYSSIAVDSYILIENSERWNGLHKVKAIQSIAGGSHGGVQTYTKVNQSTAYFTDDAVSWDANEDLTSVDTSFSEAFNASPGDNEYIWIAGSDDSAGVNNGLYSGWSFSGTTLDLSDGTKYAISSGEESATIVSWGADGAQAVYIYEAFRENGSAKFYSGVTALVDESSEIDLPNYLAKALVLYVKAKMFEDIQDIQSKEYFMKEFRKMIETHESGKIWGSRRIMAGPGAIR